MPKTETKNCMFDCVWRGVCVCVCVGGGGVRFTGYRQLFHYKIQISYPILGITFHNESSVAPFIQRQHLLPNILMLN